MIAIAILTLQTCQIETTVNKHEDLAEVTHCEWPQEATIKFTVPSADIHVVQQYRTKAKQSPYLQYISNYHSKMATVRTGYSIVNYWKRTRGQLWEHVGINALPTIHLVFILILIVI